MNLSELLMTPAQKALVWRTVLVAIVAVAMIYAVLNRTLSDYLSATAFVFILLAIFMAFVALPKGRNGNSLRERLGEFGYSLIGVAMFAPLIYSVGASLKDLYFWIQSPSLTRTQAITAGALLTAILGSALFYTRLRWRCLYGVSEALIGVVVASQRVASESAAAVKEPAFYLAVLTAGVYLVVRGLDNIHQGLTKEPLDPIAAKLASRLTESFAAVGIVDAREGYLEADADGAAARPILSVEARPNCQPSGPPHLER